MNYLVVRPRPRSAPQRATLPIHASAARLQPSLPLLRPPPPSLSCERRRSKRASHRSPAPLPSPPLFSSQPPQAIGIVIGVDPGPQWLDPASSALDQVHVAVAAALPGAGASVHPRGRLTPWCRQRWPTTAWGWRLAAESGKAVPGSIACRCLAARVVAVLP